MSSDNLPRQVKDLKGQVFGHLTVIRYAGIMPISRMALWECLCDCGRTKAMVGSRLRLGESRSCGCRQYDEFRRICSESKHGYCRNRARAPEYKAWGSIRDRCDNPKCRSWPRYGGRGIKMCEGWQEFASFIRDMGERPSPRHSIDRIDNERGYDCGHCDDCLRRNAAPNCRWATRFEQARNKRNNRRIAFGGVTRTATEWGEITGISPGTIASRIAKGWTVERALTRRPNRGRNPDEPRRPHAR